MLYEDHTKSNGAWRVPGYEFLTNSSKKGWPQIVENPDGTKSLRWETDLMNGSPKYVGPFADVKVLDGAFARDGSYLPFCKAYYVKRLPEPDAEDVLPGTNPLIAEGKCAGTYEDGEK